MRKLLLLSVILITALKVSATIRGGEITYKALGNNRYAVTFVMYKNCDSTSINPILKCRVGNDSIVADSQLLISTADVSGIGSHCPMKSRCEGDTSTPFGVQRMEWVAYFDLDTFSACEVKFFVASCCRPNDITTLTANNFYLDATFDQCLAPNSTSSIFQTTPIFYLCHNMDYEFSFSILDSGSFDSFSYHPDTVRVSESQVANYGAGHSASNWMVYWGFPNTNLPWPLGAELNSRTGEIKFRPVKYNEKSVVVTRVKQYKLINGAMTYVGYIKREASIYVKLCTNNAIPILNPNNIFSKIACAGETVCMPIVTEDTNTNDSVEISWNNGIPGATFSHNNGLVKYASGEVCWTPDSTHISNRPYNFTVTAKDNHCPLAGQAIRGFAIFVSEKPVANPKLYYKGCGRLEAIAQPNKIYGGGSFKWIVKDSSAQIVDTQAIENPVLMAPVGKAYISLIVSYGQCQTVYEDSLIIPHYTVLPPSVYLPSDTSFCPDTPFPVTILGDSSYKYQWSTGDTTSFIIASIGNFNVEVTDSFGCKINKSINITEHLLPTALIDSFSGCEGDTIPLYSSSDLGIIQSVSWHDGSAGTPYVAKNSGTIIGAGTTVDGCNFFDTFHVEIALKPTAFIDSFTACQGDTVQLYSQTDLALIQTVSWSDGSSGLPYVAQHSGTIIGSGISVDGCSFSDTLHADISKAPGAKIVYQISSDTVFFSTDINSSTWSYTWYFGDSTNATGRNQAKKYGSNGFFPVRLISQEKYCSSVDTTTVMLNVSVGEINGSSIVVYPNPFLSEMNVKVSENCLQNITIALYNVDGKLVFQDAGITPMGPEIKIDLSSANLTPGVYYMSLGCGESSYRQKVVKYD